MRIGSLLKLVAALGATALSLNTYAQSIRADVSTTVSGTYELTYAFAGTNSPYKNGDKVTFVINGTTDTLCIAGVATDSAFLRTAGAVEAMWNKPGTNTYFGLSVLSTTGAFNEINVYQGSNDNWVGQFTGSRTSTSTTCAAATTTTTTTTPTVTTDMQSIFDLAAEVMPGQFRNGGPVGLYQGYTYKYYTDSRIYVGIKDGLIYLMGGTYGNAPTSVGSIANILGQLQTAKARIAANAAANNNNSNTNTGGTTTPVTTLYTLSISGTYKYNLAVAGQSINQSIPVNFSIPNSAIPPGGVTDTTAFANLAQSQIAGLSGIGSVRITSINNTASRVTFRVEFSANLSTVGNVTIDLTYDYTK